MNHTDATHQAGNDFHHALGVALCQWAEIFLQSVEVLDVVFCFVGCIRYSAVQLHPVSHASRFCCMYDVDNSFHL